MFDRPIKECIIYVRGRDANNYFVEFDTFISCLSTYQQTLMEMKNDNNLKFEFNGNGVDLEVCDKFKVTRVGYQNNCLLIFENMEFECDEDDRLIDQLYDVFGDCILQLQDFTLVLKRRNERLRAGENVNE
jgi:hypothetical protein